MAMLKLQSPSCWSPHLRDLAATTPATERVTSLLLTVLQQDFKMSCKS